MHHKTILIIMTIIGALLVLGLLLVRADLIKASSESERKRQFIVLGLSLLAFLGLGPLLPACSADHNSGYVDVAADADTITVITSDANRSVANTEAWKRLIDTWAEAWPIARGEKGSYPFTSDEKKDLIERLNRAIQDMSDIFIRGMLRQAEWEALNASILSLKADVNKFRTVESKGATCYIGTLLPEVISLERIESRTPIISAMVESDTLQAPILERIVISLEKEVAVLESALERTQRHNPELAARMDLALSNARRAIEKFKFILRNAEPVADK